MLGGGGEGGCPLSPNLNVLPFPFWITETRKYWCVFVCVCGGGGGGGGGGCFPQNAKMVRVMFRH